MVLYWLWLSLRHGGFTLPTVANPSFPFGGWIGESKDIVLMNAGAYARGYIAPWISFERAENTSVDHTLRTALLLAKKSQIGFPLVAKPDKGCRGAGVRRVRNENELAVYIATFPTAERVVLQELVDFEAEAGVFYVREPDSARGKIISLTLKYFPYVFGDGRSTLRELIERDSRANALMHIYIPRHVHRLDQVLPPGEPYRIAFAGSHSRGTIFRDGNRYITAALEEVFDKIARDIAGFHFGRFDIRFSSIDELRQGRNFRIIEVNGAGAEATHIWDRGTRLVDAYRTLMRQYALLWKIGADNARRGHARAGLFELLSAWRKEVRLWSRYPMTE